MADGARLFTAILPPPDVTAALEPLVDTLRAAAPNLRWSPRQRWHVTLGFFGDHDDPARRERWLLRRTHGLAAPAVRLAGGGRFRGALWVGVEAAGDAEHERLLRMARACGAERRGYRPHLTVATFTGHQDLTGVTDTLAGYTGPWFSPREVALVRSDIDHTGPHYTTLATVPLTSAGTPS